MYAFLKKYKVFLLVTICFVLPSVSLLAQDSTSVAAASASPYTTLRYSMLAVAGVLVLVIIALASITKVTGKLFLSRQKNTGVKTSPSGRIIASIFLIFALPLSSLAQAAEEAVEKTIKPSIPADLYFYFSVIIVEIVIIFFLVKLIYGFLKDPNAVVVNVARPSRFLFLKKVLRPQPIEVQEKLDLQHDYDGIRELDNDIPRWWQMAFIGTFIFALVYLFRMFVSDGMPHQLQELAIANAKADEQKLAFLKESADNIDENNVAILSVEDIAQGRELFTKNCVACHGDRAQGGVGPNLTDDRWLHKGGIHDIFYSIKYGWEEKGMRSWKNDFSPKQIAQLANFIKSIENTNVEGGKEAQGDLYVEAAAIALADSAQNIQPPPSLPEKKPGD